MKIKVFSSSVESLLEEKVNGWVLDQGSMIKVIHTHFSTSQNGEDTVFSVAIFYEEL